MRRKLLKIGTVIAWAIGIAFAVTETFAWTVPAQGVQRLALAAAIVGAMMWIWTSRGTEFRLGYLRGREDEARKRD